MQELENEVGVLAVEFIEVASSFRQKVNTPHGMDELGIANISASIFSRAIPRFSARRRRRLSVADAVFSQKPRQWYASRFSGSQVIESFVCNLHIFKIFEVLDDCLFGKVSRGTPRTLGKTLQTLFNFLGQPNRKHVRNLHAEV